MKKVDRDIGSLDDPKSLCGDVTYKGHLGNGDYCLNIHSDDEISYAMTLIKQSYEIN